MHINENCRFLSVIVLMLIFQNLTSCQLAQDEPHAPASSFEILGQIKGMPDGQLTLGTLNLENNESIYEDTIQVKHEQFVLKGEVQGARLYSITWNDSARLPVFIEPGKFILKGDWNNLQQSHIAGSPEDSAFRRYGFAFNRDTGVNICLRMPDKAYAAFNLFYTSQYVDIGNDSLQQFIQQLKGNALQSVYVQPLKDLLAARQRTAIGAQAPAITIPDSTGKRWNLNNFRGRYVLLDFWASWCGPCRALIPELKEVARSLKNQPFTIVSVSFDKERDFWLRALRSEKMPWPQLANAAGWDEVSMLYGVRSVPQNFLIDPAGKIIAKNIPEGKMLAEIKRLAAF